MWAGPATWPALDVSAGAIRGGLGGRRRRSGREESPPCRESLPTRRQQQASHGGSHEMTVVRIGELGPKPRKSLLRSRVTPGMALLVLLAIAAFRLWVLETAIVEGHSMGATLLPEDRVLVLKFLRLKRFDVVVLTDPQARDTAIKRVVGLPGDTVSMVPRLIPVRGGHLPVGSQLYINGIPYDEPYAASSLPTVLPPTTLPKGSYFVLGDNRDDSIDSRVYGPVEERLIHGVATLIVYPFPRIRVIEHGAEPVLVSAGKAALNRSSAGSEKGT